MSALDMILTIYATFRSNKIRFILTLSGIMIGVALLILMSSFLESSGKAMMSAQQEAVDARMIVTVPESVPEEFRHKTTKALSSFDAEALRDAPRFHDTNISVEKRSRTTVFFHDKSKDVSLSGVSPGAEHLYKLEVIHGRLFNDDDFSKKRRVCLIGDEIWRDLANRDPALINKQVRFEGHLFRVIGILDKKFYMGKTSSIDLWDRKIIIPVTTFKITIRPDSHVEMLYVRLPLFDDLKKITSLFQDNIKAILLHRHYGMKNFEFRDNSMNDASGKMMENVIRVLFIGISALALLVGGINIMNIMLITVTERTREIGIRRALGCTRKTILKQFLLEAGVISFAGGVSGIIVGVVLYYLLYLGLDILWGSWFFIIDIKTVIVGAVVSFATGIIFGFYPAVQASRLSPEECLRYE